LHVPAQSGSNAVLRRMKRGYTVEEYREMLSRIRATIPDSAVTSDFIVGFCGETEDDFRETVELVRESRFKNSFIFKYSPRPGTKGAELFADDVPEDEKRRRNNELLAIQNEISEDDNQPFIGREVEILVEGPSKSSRKHARGLSPFVRAPSPRWSAEQKGTVPFLDADANGPLQLTGRTHCDRIVVFDGNPRQIGQLLPVTIYDANAFTLFGSVVTRHVGPELFEIGAGIC
jgi:tRNA-2-methylthio-N6-dimethylallyladenosine synthase